MLIARCCDSFDCYTDLTQNYDSVIQANSISAITISNTATRTGLNGLKSGSGSFATFGGQSYIQQAFNSNLATVIIGFAIQPKTWGSVDSSGYTYQLLTLVDGGFEQCHIGITNGGQISAWRGTTLLGISTNALALNVWRYLEVKTTIHNSTGAIEIRVDGVVWLTLTGLNTRAGTSNNYATSLALGTFTSVIDAARIPLTWYIDDLVTLDTTGSYNNTYIGDVAIKCKFPNANGTTQQWTRNTGANNYAAVNENPPDGDTTYVSDATVGEIDRNLYPATTGTLVKAVIARPFARKDDGVARSIRAVTKSGATLGDNGADFALSTSYAYYHGLFETDPNTSAAWLIAAVNAAEFGVKVTV